MAGLHRLGWTLGCLSLGLLGCAQSKLTVTAVEPASGSVGGGETVLIRGGGFAPGRTACTVQFGAHEASNLTILSDDKIQGTTPAGHKGLVDVMVTFDDGRTFKLGDAFLYRTADQAQTRDVFLSGGNKPKP